MNKFCAFFRLVRWPNLLLTALMMFLVENCVMLPIAASSVDALPSHFSFTLLVLGMVFVVAGGYIINDICDVDIDKINRPNRVVIGKAFSAREGEIIYWIFTILGIGLATYVGYRELHSRFYMMSLFFILLAGVLHSYSTRYKRRVIVGNVVVAICVASAVFLPWLFAILRLSHVEIVTQTTVNAFHYTLPFVLLYTGFAFLTTLIREIVKDMEDCAGDRQGARASIALEWGMTAAKIITVVLEGVLVVTLYLAHQQFNTKNLFVMGSTMQILGLVSLIPLIGIIFGKDPKQFHSASLILKILMFLGVASMALIIS